MSNRPAFYQKHSILTREQMQELIAEHGSMTAAAKAIGMSRTTFRDRYHAAESTYYQVEDENGQVRGQWVKYPPLRQGRESVREIIEEAKEALRDVPARPVIRKPILSGINPHEQNVYIVADHHLLMLAWAPEVGQNYDLKIAEEIFYNTAEDLVASAPNTDTAILLNLGDWLHVNDNSARTERSGNKLDVEGRFFKGFRLGVDLMVWYVERLLKKHRHVKVRMLPGNHDEHASLTTQVALAMAFRHNDRVTVELSPETFWAYGWGKTMLVAHHGHEVKPQDMPGVMAAYWPELWGRTSHRYALLGHIHHRSVGGDERNGAAWETFQTLAGKDAYHYARGYSSGRSMVAITYDDRGGESGRVIKQLRNG